MFKALLFLSASLLFLFLALPSVNLVAEQVVSFESFFEVLRSWEAWRAILLTLAAAVLSSGLAITFGTPLAYLLARHNFRGKAAVEALIDAPMAMPHIVAGIALFILLSPSGLVGSPLQALGVRIEDSFLGIVAAMLFVSSPFFVNTARKGFESVDPKLEKVAQSLGASEAQAFFTVTLPLSSKHLATGVVQSLARAISEFSAILVLAYFPKSVTILVYEWFITHGKRLSLPLATILLLMSLLLLLSLRCLRSRG